MHISCCDVFIVTDILNSQETTQTNSFIIILNIKLHHINHFTSDHIRHYVDCWDKMYPMPIRMLVVTL